MPFFNFLKTGDSHETSKAKSVLIIGSGLSGRETAKALLSVRNPPAITIVEANDYYEWDVTAPKALRKGDMYEANYSAPQYQLAIDGVVHVKGKVAEVRKEGDIFEARLEDGRILTADGMVVATGFSTGLIKPAVGSLYEDRKKDLANYRKALAEADNIIIAGGGPVGVDICGELLPIIKTGATITQVVSDEALFLTQRHSERERRIVTDRVRSFENVRVEFGEKVTDGGKDAIFGKRDYTLKSGKKVTADVYIPAFAVFDRAQFLSGIPGALAANGTVAVDKNSLMSNVAFNLYAVGCSDCGEMCSIPKIADQAKSVAKNLAFTLEGKQPGHKHSEGVAFMKAEALVPHGNWAVVMMDEIGPLGVLFCICGFPFPCCLAPCVPACGICGANCQRPEGKMPGEFWDWAMSKGPAGPVLEKANKKLPPPSLEIKR